MEIYIPFTKLEDATKISLIGYDYIPVELTDDFTYDQYFEGRWDAGESFINIEHDCVIWPGAIESLEECPEMWCVFDYHLPNHRARSLEAEVNGIPLGCMKITDKMIKQIPECWKEPVAWDKCDQHLTKYALAHGLKVHQHYPGIVNANKALIGG